MENESGKDNGGVRLMFEWQREEFTIQLKASKKMYANLFDGLMPAIYAGLLAASVFFSSPNTGSKSPPPASPASCPTIEAPAVRQGESA
jgi:hypothetical protein